MPKKLFWRIKKKPSLEENYNNPGIINYKKMLKKGAWDKNTKIPESLIGKTVLVFDNENERPFYVTREKVGFKFGDFDCDNKLNGKIDKKIKKKEKANTLTLKKPKKD